MSPQSDPSSLDDAIRLKRFQNTLVPICRLPIEILVAIFYESARTVSSPNLSTKGRLKITAICYWWRVLARSHRALWASINCTGHPDLIQMFWQLSHPLPTSLSLFGAYGVPSIRTCEIKWDRLMTVCAFLWTSGAQRIVDMEVHIPWGNEAISAANRVLAFIESLRPSASHLKAVSLSSQYFYRSTLVSLESFLLLKDAIISGSIECLKLKDIDVRPLLSLQTWPLRVLHIISFRQQKDQEPLIGWLSLLHGLAPCLEDLRLETYNELELSPRNANPGTPVRMLKLRDITLSLPTNGCVMSILDNIKLVLSSVTNITVSTHRDPPLSWKSIASFLNHHHSGHISHEFSLQMTEDSFIMKSRNNKASIKFVSFWPNYNSVRRWYMWSPHLNEFIDHLDPSLRAQVLDLQIKESYLPSLDSELPTFPTYMPWRDIANCFSNVQSLTISTGPMSDTAVVWAWNPLDYLLDDETYHDIFVPRNIHSSLLTKLADPDCALDWFPALRNLRFVGHRLERVTTHDGETQLLEFLRHRSKNSTPIERIVLDGDSRISSIFRHSVAHVSPTTVVELDRSRQQPKRRVGDNYRR